MIHKTIGFVLKRIQVMNTSVAATFYTKDFGKIKVLFKGFERTKPLFASRLAIFSLNEVVFYENKNSLYKIAAECSLLENFPQIRGGLKTTGYASYMIELLDCLTDIEDSQEDIFGLLCDSLKLLSSRPFKKGRDSSLSYNGMEIAVRAYELRLINSLGIKPGWDEWIKSQGDTISQGALNSLNYLEREDFDKIQRFKMSAKVSSELENLTKNFLNCHLDRPLKSRRWLEKIHR